MIGRFALLDALGDGGTATVWHARDPLTGQPAAVKLLREELTRIPEQRRAFLAEAQLGGRVAHPGVVHIIDCGEQERPGLPPQAWLAMELLDGRSLAEEVHATRLALAENAVVTAPVPVPVVGASGGTRVGAGAVAGIGARAGAEPGAWTGARAPQGGTAHPASAVAGALRGRRVSGRGLLVAGAAVVAAVLAAGGVLGVFGDRATPRVDAVTAASTQAAASPTAAPTPAAQRLTQVPELLGRSLAEARALLEAAGLTVGQLGTSHSASPADTVLAMAQPAGMRVAPGTAVALTVASGWNAVPSTTGMTEAEAVATLTAAGFTATAQLASGSNASPGSSTTPRRPRLFTCR